MLLDDLAIFCENGDMNMLQYVIAQLNARKGAWPELCEVVPGVKYSWLSKLALGKIPEPSVVKIQALHDHFRANPIAESGAAVAVGNLAPVSEVLQDYPVAQ